VPYAPLHPADDLARCQRYYYVVGGLPAFEFVTPGMCHGATAWAGAILRFPVEMAVTPSLTVSAAADWAVYAANGAVTACATVTMSGQTRRSTAMSGTVAAGLVAGNGTALFANNTLNARLQFEANP